MVDLKKKTWIFARPINCINIYYEFCAICKDKLRLKKRFLEGTGKNCFPAKN